MDSKVLSLVVVIVSQNIAAVGLGVCAILFLRWYFDRDRRDIARLPGPRPLPFIGNLNLMWSKGPGNTVLDNIVPTFHELSKQFFEHGFFCFYFGSRAAVMVFKPETAEPIFTSSVNISKAPNYQFLRSWLGNGLLLSTGNNWKQHRKLLTNAFHFKVLDGFVPAFNEHSQHLCDFIRETGQLDDVATTIKACALSAMCETSLGENIDFLRNQDCNYLGNIHEFLSLLVERVLTPWHRHDCIYGLSSEGSRASKSAKQLKDFTKNIFEKRKQEKLEGMRNNASKSTNDKKKRLSLLDLLLSYHLEDESITQQECLDHLDTFTFGGHDTTALTLTFALWRIARHPKVQERLQQEIDTYMDTLEEKFITAEGFKHLPYLEMFLKETQRVHPVASNIARTLTEDLYIGGCRIPKGMGVGVDIYSLHRNPEVFKEPYEFRPERFDPESDAKFGSFAYTPFSGGPRNCIGYRFALTEMKIFIAHIVRDFTLQLVDFTPELETTYLVLEQPKYDLKIRFLSRT